MTIETVDCVVVGAGAVGLAAARALALAGREVILLEAADAIGTGTSSRNSEVIHAGIYYPAGSLKARLCVRGKALLYDYASQRGIPAEAVGKLIVATSQDQVPVLAELRASAHRNGVQDVDWIAPEAARAMEPELACVAALQSPSSGIVDSHALMLAFQGDLEALGGMVAFESPILSAAVEDDGIRLEVGGAEPMTLRCRGLVNAAGLAAPDIARRIAGLPPELVPQPRFAKGTYCSLVGTRAPFRRLIYPVPEQAGLGIHATVDLGGQTRFGPDVQWVDRPDYAADSTRIDGFYAAIRRYWPGLPDGALVASYAGVRPKIVGPGEPAADFVIQGPEAHGVPGLVNLFGIESPGLTASLAIAEEVCGRLAGARAAA